MCTAGVDCRYCKNPGVLACPKVAAAFGPGQPNLGYVEPKPGGRRQSGWYGRANPPRGTDTQPCSRCHKNQRIPSKSGGRPYSWCRECRAERDRTRRRNRTENQRERARKVKSAWYKRTYADPEKRKRIRAYALKYYYDHKETMNAKDRERRRK